jgi:hypothetical protein
MPLDASDRIRRTQETTIFTGFAIQRQTLQPGVNVSTCATFYTSTLFKYPSYEYGTQVEQGRVYFSTCQGVNNR